MFKNLSIRTQKNIVFKDLSIRTQKSGIIDVFSRVFPLCSNTCLYEHKIALGDIKHTNILFKAGRIIIYTITHMCTLLVCHVILVALY